MKKVNPIRVAERREKAGLSYPALARRISKTGTRVSWQAIRLVETGKTKRPKFLPELARELETTPEYLTNEIDDPSPLASTEAKPHNKNATKSSTSGEFIMDEARSALYRRIMDHVFQLPYRRLQALANYLDLDETKESTSSPAARGKTSL